MMNRGEDPLLRQHRARLLALAETSSGGHYVKPPNNTKRRPNSVKSPVRTGSGKSNHSKITLQDFVRNDPGYTPNIEHLVFPNRKAAAAAAAAAAAPSTQSGHDVTKTRSRLAEMFALSRHLQQRSADRELKNQQQSKKVLNRSIDSSGLPPRELRGGAGHQPSVASVVGAQSSSTSAGSVSTAMGPHSRWAQHLLADESTLSAGTVIPTGGLGGGGGSAPATARVSPNADSDHSGSCVSAAAGMAMASSARGSNVSILHLRSTSEPWDRDPIPSNHLSQPSTSSSAYTSGGSTLPQTGSLSGSHSARSYSSTRASSMTAASSALIRDQIHGNLALTKHQSLGGSNGYGNPRKKESTLYHAPSSQMTSQELFVSGGTCSRELSPVRWCDREVDGVYLGRSGWVQVQQRSLDENRRSNYEMPSSCTNIVSTTSTVTIPQTRRTIKLADYHCNSEPSKYPELIHASEPQRPAYLPLRRNECEPSSTTPSPHSIPESYSPPSITPIISPPPAFQDAKSSKTKSRYYYGTKPFLPRSKAIDTDIISPPASPPPPPINWSTLPTTRVPAVSPQIVSQQSQPTRPRPKLTPSPISSHSLQHQYRLPQTKSLEDTTPSRRSQFVQRYIESSSSSSSASLGFRSLDSCVNRSVMPRLAENTDSSVEGYEDGDEEEISSSINLSGVSSIVLNSSPESINGRNGGNREKVSPSGRHSRISHHRTQSRRSPAASDANKQVTCSSPDSSSSCSPPGRSPSGGSHNYRRTGTARPHQTARAGQQQIDPNVQRVRRSRSLQLPEKRSPGSGGSGRENYPIRVSPQQAPEPHRVVVKIANSADRPRRHITSQHSGSTTHSFEAEIDDDVLREAEVVTEFLYGSRSRAAAKALLMHRFYDRREEKEPPARAPIDNGYNVFFVSGGNGAKQPPTQQQQRQKVLQRGATTPNMSSPMFSSSPTTEKNPCTSSTCDFWPHCAHRDTLSSQAQAIFSGNMRISQSYPTHQRQANDTAVVQRQDSGSRSTPAALERMQEPEQQEAVSGGSGSGSSGNHRKGRNNNGRASSAVSATRRPVGISGNGIDKTLHVERETNRCSEVIIINSERDRLTTRVGPDQRRIVGNTSTGVVVVSKRDKSSDRGAIKTSPVNAKSANVSRSPSAVGNSSSNSSSSSDIWVTTSDRTATKSPRNIKSSGASTPLDETTSFKSDQIREMILTRPGSAPASNTKQDRSSNKIDLTESQQRSMSLPKSFMSKSSKQSGQFPWKRQTTESPCSTPSPRHRAVTPETVHTAPVTPSHDLVDRRRSPGAHTRASRRVKASSTPHLLEQNVTAASPQHGSNTWDASSERNWSNKRIGDRCDDLGLVNTPGVSPHHARSSIQSQETPKDQTYQQQQRPISGCTTESVLQKFRKTFSLRFQKKGSKESCSTDYDGPSQGSLEESVEIGSEPAAEEDSPQHAAHETQPAEDTTEQKYRFGPLIWRSSKERKKNNKAARNAKCNSGDSGIQIEMASGCSGGGAGGDSSESHETDSPPAVRRRVTTGERGSRPHSDLINQILIDKFKADLQSRSSRHQHVRRTHSDLGGRRLLQWDTRGGPYRRMLSSPSPIRARPGSRVSPRHAPPAAPGGVVLRPHRTRPGRPQLRRSLSQPLDIDKLSPLMRTKASGLRSHGTHILSEDEHDCRGGTSDDEMISDSESSIASLTERKRSLEMAMDEEVVILAEAVWDHVTMEPEELAFRAGDVIEVLETVDRDWWWGATGGQVGWFPAAFVRLRVSQEDTVEDCLAAMASGQSSSTQLRRRTSISLLSNEQVRTSVVRELVHTERDFVKVLRDVSEGYITECRRRTDMFTEEQIETIFINIEDLLEFQAAFLRDLEACIDWEAPHKSCLGECFLKHKSGFRMYSDYCNSHPMATATLQELYQHNSYSKFFEACRLMRGLIEIPLDGYLLTPVQRICKYPLQLAELLKYTKVDHPDYNKIQEALDAMKGVAVLINERKRRMESLEKLAAWQQRVEGWEGEDLIEISSQLIHQGDAIRVTTGMWTNNITLFLFDHQIVYCKKDIIKRNTYVYKGRICLDTSEIIDVADGKEPQLGVSVRHGIKIYSCVRDKWLLFCCRNANEKECWLSALAEERRLVAKDRLEGLDFPPAARQLARIAARRLRRPPTKPRNGKNYKRDSTYVGSLLQLNSQHNSNSLGRKMGTWFTFGSNKKGRPQHVPS